jgi:hypothetical protein
MTLPSQSLFKVVYYESIKRELKRRLIYEYRCDGRLITKNEESKCLSDTGLVVELEHLKTKTRLIDKKFESVLIVVYYESIKREVKIKPIYEYLLFII